MTATELKISDMKQNSSSSASVGERLSSMTSQQEEKPEPPNINPRTGKPRAELPENKFCEVLSYEGSGLTQGQLEYYRAEDRDEMPSEYHLEELQSQWEE